MFGGSEININFRTPIPVHITYQSAFVDDEGKLQIRDDVYGRDQKLLAIMKGSERKVADTAIDRPKGSTTARRSRCRSARSAAAAVACSAARRSSIGCSARPSLRRKPKPRGNNDRRAQRQAMFASNDPIGRSPRCGRFVLGVCCSTCPGRGAAGAKRCTVIRDPGCYPRKERNRGPGSAAHRLTLRFVLRCAGTRV